ncbi:MAG: DNA repair protein RecN, partial [Litorimonas sp.]
DQVRFTVSTNPGTPLGPLDKIASGGEMARFALAIKVALAARTESVMVFDEVDQGVGGAVATAVGRRLAKLSETAQVFVVTHSPQVAASADHQFRIEKTSTGTSTNTHVHAIAAAEREEEIARMLAGETVTDAARAAARQLIAS